MTFIHAPTLFSLAIGGGLTLWDLFLYQRRATSQALEDLLSFRLAHGTVLDHLEASGIVEVTRDSWGEIVRVTIRVDPSAFATSLLELGRREFSPRIHAPLSN